VIAVPGSRQAGTGRSTAFDPNRPGYLPPELRRLPPGRPALAAKLREPGRMAEFLKTFKSTPADAEKQLPNIRCPALVIMGTADPDFAAPRAEGEAIIAAMPAGAGTVAMAGGAGHYPHAQSPRRWPTW
jgi:pimeloyl-ACP methyl ester carboxylesterase